MLTRQSCSLVQRDHPSGAVSIDATALRSAIRRNSESGAAAGPQVSSRFRAAASSGVAPLQQEASAALMHPHRQGQTMHQPCHPNPGPAVGLPQGGGGLLRLPQHAGASSIGSATQRVVPSAARHGASGGRAQEAANVQQASSSSSAGASYAASSRSPVAAGQSSTGSVGGSKSAAQHAASAMPPQRQPASRESGPRGGPPQRCAPAVASLRLLAVMVTAAAFATAVLGPRGAAADGGGWMEARSTYYGGADDWWNINEGSCGYGYLDRDKGTGWDVAALADGCRDYSGSCGRCYEVKCNHKKIRDNYGETLDRSKVCYDTSASVIVQVTDSCPCNYPSNAFSNRRWCCGDMYHMDLSVWAFEKLADKKWGVIPTLIRRVPCHQQPGRKAQLPSGKSPSAPNLRVSRPPGWKDRRPWS